MKKRFKETKTWIHAYSDKAFNGTVVNWVLPAFHEGSLEITCSVPLILD